MARPYKNKDFIFISTPNNYKNFVLVDLTVKLKSICVLSFCVCTDKHPIICNVKIIY